MSIAREVKIPVFVNQVLTLSVTGPRFGGEGGCCSNGFMYGNGAYGNSNGGYAKSSMEGSFAGVSGNDTSSMASVSMGSDFQTSDGASGNPVDRPSKAAVNYKSENRDKIIEIVNNNQTASTGNTTAPADT